MTDFATELVPTTKARTTKVESVTVVRKTLTVQSRTMAWAAAGLFFGGFALGVYSQPPSAASASVNPTTTVTAVAQPTGK